MFELPGPRTSDGELELECSRDFVPVSGNEALNTSGCVNTEVMPAGSGEHAPTQERPSPIHFTL